MRFEDERYVRVYTRDTLTWLSMSWEANALLTLLLRKCDRAGLLEVGKNPVRGLAAHTRMPAEVVERSLPALLEPDEEGVPTVEIRGTMLIVPKFIEAQEAVQSDRLRASESRARHRDKARFDEITQRDEPSRNVTGNHETGQNVTRPPTSVTPYCTVPIQPKELVEPATPPLELVPSKPPAPDPIKEQLRKLWEIYPKKDAKDAGLAAFKKAIQKHGFERVKAALERWLEKVRREGTERKYLPLPASWVNRYLGGYLEEDAAVKPGGGALDEFTRRQIRSALPSATPEERVRFERMLQEGK